MRVGFIGAGTMGTAVGILLKDKGYMISGYCSRTFSSAEKAAEAVGGTAFFQAADLVRHSDIIFISTPDDAVGETARSISSTGALRHGHILAHFSGSLNAEILRPQQPGVFVVSIHPLQSCASVEQAVANLPGSIFSLEGNDRAVKTAEQIVEALGGEHFVLQGEDKALYHAAACTASNYLVTLFHLAVEMLGCSGVPEKMRARCLLPLVKGTVSNLAEMPPSKALTGPIARGDVGTVRDHLRVMEKEMPHLVDFYKCMGALTLELSREKGKIGKDAADELAKIFVDETGEL